MKKEKPEFLTKPKDFFFFEGEENWKFNQKKRSESGRKWRQFVLFFR